MCFEAAKMRTPIAWLTCVLTTVALPAAAFAADVPGDGPHLPHPLAKALGVFCHVGSGLVAAIGVALMGLALVLVVSSWWPNASKKISSQLDGKRPLCFLVGLLNVLFLFALTAVTKGKLGVIALPVFTILFVLGIAAVSEDLGRRFHRMAGVEGSRFGWFLSGWLLTFFTSVIPFLGWFIIAPYFVFLGCGSVVVALFTKAHAARPDDGRVSPAPFEPPLAPPPPKI
jgi:hypothetical protein